MEAASFSFLFFSFSFSIKKKNVVCVAVARVEDPIQPNMVCSSVEALVDDPIRQG